MAITTDEEFKSSFCDLGTQYYVAGRSVARAGLNPVYGNLLHHAVEMFLKGVLVGPLTVKELTKMGHDLPQLWEAYNAKEKDAALSRFDATITALHPFESIRYPDEIVGKGLLVSIAWAPTTRPPSAARSSSRLSTRSSSTTSTSSSSSCSGARRSTRSSS